MRSQLYKSLAVCAMLLLVSVSQAQDNIHVHTHSYNTTWEFPLSVDDVNYFDFNSSQTRLRANVQGGVVVPFIATDIDTITFKDAPTTFTENPYKVFPMYITTTKDGFK